MFLIWPKCCEYLDNKYAFISDIEKAFLIVALNEADMDCTRFLCPRDPLNTNSPLDICRFKLIIFCSTYSQYLLNVTIAHQLANMREQGNIINTIGNELYIDNLLGKSFEKYWQIQKIFNKVHLYLRRWVTSSLKLQDQLVIVIDRFKSEE